MAPRALKTKLPMGEAANCTLVDWRPKIRRVLAREDAPLLVITRACLIHDPELARHGQDQGQYMRASFPAWGDSSPNYFPECIVAATDLLEHPGLGPVVVADYGHDNPGKRQ